MRSIAVGPPRGGESPRPSRPTIATPPAAASKPAPTASIGPVRPRSPRAASRAGAGRIGDGSDLWTEGHDLIGVRPDDATFVLSHNPDFAETIRDARVGLVLSGHTQGGRVVGPGSDAPIVLFTHGQNFLNGPVQGPVAQVSFTRGVGTITPPVQFLCRPEGVVMTLA